MDACGSLLGPIVAFVLLAALPGQFDAVWVTSFVFAVLGVAALWLFVPKSAPSGGRYVPGRAALVGDCAPGDSWCSRDAARCSR